MTVRSVRVDQKALVGAMRGSSALRRWLQPVAAKATRTSQAVARDRLTMRTNVYVSSFGSHVGSAQRTAEVARIVTENTAPYAGFLEKGTRPHVMPKKATVYVFQGSSGQTVFTHGPIHHPGTQPYRVIEVALKRVAAGMGA